MAPTYPFQRANPLGYALFEELSSAELTQIDENAAAGADGSAYTDVALFANLPLSFSDANGGRALVYNPVLREFFSFSNLAGFRSRNPFTIRAALSIPAAQGLTMFAPGQLAACRPDTGLMVVCGDTSSSSQNRYRYSTNGTLWQVGASSVAPSTDGPCWVMWCGAPLNRWVAGSHRGGVWDGLAETSEDGVEWTPSVFSELLAMRRAAYSPTLPMIMTVPASGSALRYLTSKTGLSGSWSAHDSPALFQTCFWSEHYRRFYASSMLPSRAFSSVDGVAWVELPPYPTDDIIGWFEFGRLLGYVAGGGDVVTSLDGGASWAVAVDASGSALTCLALGANQLLLSRASAHLATMRWGGV